jgi:hypothetical protein
VIVLGLACTALTFMLYYQLIAEVGEEERLWVTTSHPSSRSSTG